MESFQFTADDIGVGLLESITLGLYREAGDVLREYISNEIDNEPAPASVDIRIEEPNQTVMISGDGPGMDWQQFRKAVKIGVSFKDPRVNIGFRGIGIWAGVAACRELTVSTKSDSDDNEYTLIVDCDKLRTFFSGPDRNKPLIEVLNLCAGYRRRPSKRYHGTEVTLKGMLPNFQVLLDEDKVRGYLTQECPVAFEEGFRYATAVEKRLKSELPAYRRVKMTLNGTPVRGLHIAADVREPIFGEISVPLSDGTKNVVLGFYWMCHGKETARFPEGYDSGLRVRIKNFTVAQPATVQAHVKARVKGQNMHMFEYWIGEIHATHPEIKPNAERNDLEPSLAADHLMDYVSGDIFSDLMVPISRTLSEHVRLQDETARASGVSTIVRPRDYADVFAVKVELDEVDEQINDLDSRRQKLKARSKELSRKQRDKKVQGLEKITKEIESGLGTKVDRAISHLRSRRQRLQTLFESKKKSELQVQPAKETPQEKTAATTGQQAKIGAETDASTGQFADTKAMQIPQRILDLVKSASIRVATFEADSSKLTEAFLIALFETGVCKTEDDLRKVVDALIRVSQRRR